MTRKVVIGCGNPLAADDGIGLKVIEELKERGVPLGVKLVAAGLPGLALLDYMRGADEAILVDAVDAGKSPGTVIIAGEKDIPHINFRSLSLHQIGIAETLALARIVEPQALPRRLHVVGIQVGNITFGREGLSREVLGALPYVLEVVYNLLNYSHP